MEGRGAPRVWTDATFVNKHDTRGFVRNFPCTIAVAYRTGAAPTFMRPVSGAPYGSVFDGAGKGGKGERWK